MTGERWYSKWQVPDVPAGTKGDWCIDSVEVTEAEARWASRLPRRLGGADIDAGVYRRLRCGRTVVMSDTPDEIGDHRQLFDRARGTVLLNGLGLGMALNGVASKPEVERVIVVELSRDVLDLVAPHYLAKFRHRGGAFLWFNHADAMTWKPPEGMRFGAVWHDIWPHINPDNVDQMKTLHRRYGRKTDWQGSWARDLCEMHR